MNRNRRFHVRLQDQKSRWRNLKNGLPQGSVLAPILFNVYTNDQPILENTRHFLYADDLAITAQGNTFSEVEQTLTLALMKLNSYYIQNSLKPNPTKTQVSAFHLNNKQAKKELKIQWRDINLEHTQTPTYLGVILDRTLTFKSNCEKIKMKVTTRNNLIRKLTGTTWGANPQLLRTTALALCYSAGEYACPVWSRSCHAKKVDVALNETCRLITGCLKPTPIPLVHVLAGVAPPDIRRSVASDAQKTA